VQIVFSKSHFSYIAICYTGLPKIIAQARFLII
jgi:hypothetical protein